LDGVRRRSLAPRISCTGGDLRRCEICANSVVLSASWRLLIASRVCRSVSSPHAEFLCVDSDTTRTTQCLFRPWLPRAWFPRASEVADQAPTGPNTFFSQKLAREPSVCLRRGFIGRACAFPPIAVCLPPRRARSCPLEAFSL